MEPNSLLTMALLFALAAGAIFCVARLKHLALKVASGVLAMALAMFSGMAVVNDFYGYYQSWGQLSDDLTGSYASFADQHVAHRGVTSDGKGQVVSVDLPGARSGIDRSGLVYLPPQYYQPAYAHTRFPVVELLHGTPGTPSDWIVHLKLAAAFNQLLADHQVGPMVVVMPTMSVGSDYEECVDAPGALDDTYITDDVRDDIEQNFRVSTDSAEWGVGGYSSGGYCAANLALRHPDMFGASAIMDGYFRPTDGPAVKALHYDQAAENANNPLIAAGNLTRNSYPLPSFWVSVGTGDGGDLAAAQAFAKALHGVEQVTLYREAGASHNFYAWLPAVPRSLAWMWTQLAPPNLRVEFPISGPVSSGGFAAPPAPKVPTHKPVKHPSPARHSSAPASSSSSPRPSPTPSPSPSPSPSLTRKPPSSPPSSPPSLTKVTASPSPDASR